VPAAIGFAAGGLALYAADVCLPMLGLSNPEQALAQMHKKDDDTTALDDSADGNGEAAAAADKTWRRVMLLVIAITVHNFPEGMAGG
jgi:zinc transporter ZupT